VNKLLADILKLGENPEKLRSRSKAGSNPTTNGKNSNAGSRGTSKPRTRQGTPVNQPTTPTASGQQSANPNYKITNDNKAFQNY